MRRPILTAEQADDLENELSSIVADNGYEKKYVKPYLKGLGLPEDLVKGILARVDGILHGVACVEGEPSQRDLYESVVDSYHALDSYLNKSIRVTSKRRGSRKPFTFNVG